MNIFIVHSKGYFDWLYYKPSEEEIQKATTLYENLRNELKDRKKRKVLKDYYLNIFINDLMREFGEHSEKLIAQFVTKRDQMIKDVKKLNLDDSKEINYQIRIEHEISLKPSTINIDYKYVMNTEYIKCNHCRVISNVNQIEDKIEELKQIHSKINIKALKPEELMIYNFEKKIISLFAIQKQLEDLGCYDSAYDICVLIIAQFGENYFDGKIKIAEDKIEDLIDQILEDDPKIRDIAIKAILKEKDSLDNILSLTIDHEIKSYFHIIVKKN